MGRTAHRGRGAGARYQGTDERGPSDGCHRNIRQGQSGGY